MVGGCACLITVEARIVSVGVSLKVLVEGLPGISVFAPVVCCKIRKKGHSGSGLFYRRS